jgi:hypothetical protein
VISLPIAVPVTFVYLVNSVEKKNIFPSNSSQTKRIKQNSIKAVDMRFYHTRHSPFGFFIMIKKFNLHFLLYSTLLLDFSKRVEYFSEI